MNSLNKNNGNCTKKITIPEGFRELLQDLAVEVLRSQPKDILNFSLDFLKERKEAREKEKSEDTSGTARKKIGMIAPPPTAGVVMKIGVMHPEKIITESFLFTNVPKEAVEEFKKKNEIKTLEVNEELTLSGKTDSPIIYFIQSGKMYLYLETSNGKHKVAELTNSGYFGDEIEALIVVAKTPVKLVMVKKEDISPVVMNAIKTQRDKYKEFIEDMELFENMNSYCRRMIVDSMSEKIFEPDVVIFEEGSHGTELFLVFEGFVSIQQEGKEINTVGESNYFGEIAIIQNENRAATAVTISNVTLMSVPLEIFKTFIEHQCKMYLDKQIKGYFKTDETDNDDSESEMITPQFEKVNLPRKSVSAGKFNPEMDDDEDDEDMFEGINEEDLIKTEEQRVRLRLCCKNILLFRCLDDEQLEVVIDAMFQRVAKPGDVIIKRGDDGDNFYVVDNGIFDIIVPVNDVDTVVAQYKNEGSFGELALMYNTPRSATVIAKTDGLLWAMNREMFRKIVLKKAFQKRLMYENLLAQVPLFKNISTYERTNVADALRTRVYEADAPIIKQGEEGHDMFFIEEGKVEIYVDYHDGSEPEMLGELERGKYFGEMALINHKPRAATITAKTKCKIAVLDRESFERLLGPCIDVMKRNMQDYGIPSNRKSLVPK